jgi:hypothetical protein
MIKLREFLSELTRTSTFCIFFVEFPCKRCVLGDVFAQMAPATTLHDENIADLVSGPAARFKRRT